MQWLVFDLRDGIPARDFDRADRDRALGVTTGFLALHHAPENLLGVEIRTGGIQQRIRIGLQDPWNEPRPHLRAARIAPGRVERVAHDRLSIAHDVRHHSND
jgi:hypothetical protein